MNYTKKHQGFTIVELLIVIVVIGILAAITIVAFNGVLRKANIATIESDLSNAVKTLKSAEITTGTYPADTTDVRASSGVTYQYSRNTSVNPQTFCITATKGTLSYYITQDGGKAIEGACPGHIANGGPVPNSFTTLTITPRTGPGNRGWTGAAMSADGTKIVAVAQSSNIYTSMDSGVTWVAQTGSGARDWKNVTMSDDGTKIAAAVTDGYIYTSTDSGVTWSERQGAGMQRWSDIDGSADGSVLIAVAQGSTTGRVYVSADSGSSWTQRETVRDFRGAAIAANGNPMYAIEYGGYLRRSTDTGVTWTAVTTMGAANWASAVCSATCNSIIIGASSSSSFRSIDGGATRANTGLGTSTVYAAALSDDGTKMIAAPQNSRISTSLDSGATWLAQTSIPTANWYAAAASSDASKFVIVAYLGGIYTGSWQ